MAKQNLRWTLGLIVAAGIIALGLWLVIPGEQEVVEAPEPLTKAKIERALKSPNSHFVGVVSVRSRSYDGLGTKSERAQYTLKIREKLSGAAPAKLKAERFSYNRRNFLSRGEDYLVIAWGPLEHREGAFGLASFEPYSEERHTPGREAEVKAWIAEALASE